MKIGFRLTEYNRFSFIPLYHVIKQNFPDARLSLVGEEEIPEVDVLFFSFMSFNALEVYEEVRKLRGRGITLIAGGPHVTAKPKEALLAGFDAVVLGEGEHAVVELIDDWKKDSLKRIYSGKTVKEIDYSLESSFYTAPVEIVRGCINRCKFCQVPFLFRGGLRYRSLESVVKEAKILFKRGRRFIRFIAPNSLSYFSEDGRTPNLKALRELFEKVKDVGIEEIFFGSFPSEVRPESVTPEAASLMREYCANKRVVIGAQSGSDERLLKLKRGHTVSHVVRAVEILNDYGFIVVLDFIFGFPGETEEELRETLNFIEKMLSFYNVKIHAHYFIPLPGTPYSKAIPSPLPKWFRTRLHELERMKLLDGYWVRQEEMGRRLWGAGSP